MARVYCQRCNRPEKVCLCASISKQSNTRTLIIFQHDDEQKKPLSTVPLIQHGLSGVEVLNGLRFDREKCFSLLAKHGACSPLLLYPESLSDDEEHLVLDLSDLASPLLKSLQQYDSLVILDGTWRNTRELVLVNTWLQSLPTLALLNAGKSRYRIRKSTHEFSLSTIEAVAKVLPLLDENIDSETLLKPFEKMIDQQIQYMGEEVFLRNYR